MKQSLQDFRLSLSLKPMLWVGLTGCIGCGKSTLASIFSELGYPVLSADEIVKDLYNDEEIVTTIKKELNLDVHLGTSELIEALSKTVFKDKNKLKRLEAILHPEVKKRVLDFRKTLKSKIAFYDVPLLFEKNMEDQFDFIICVGLDKENQKQRIQIRNKSWSDEEVDNRIKNQKPIELKRKGSDFYIDNNGSLENLKAQAHKVLNALIN